MGLSLLLFSCGRSSIWHIPLSEMKPLLQKGDYSFLKSIDFDSARPSEALKIKEGGGYFFYRILKQEGYPETAAEVLRAGWRKGAREWRPLCGETLIAHYLETEEFGSAGEVALDFLKKYPGHEKETQIKLDYLQSLYLREMDATLLEQGEKWFARDFQGEWLLYKGIALFRQSKPGWKKTILSLFTHTMASNLHLRVYKFFEFREQLDLFTTRELKIIKGKYFLAYGRREEGIELLMDALKDMGEDDLKGSVLIRELGFAFIYAGQWRQGSVYMEDMSERLTGEEQLSALELCGRLYRRRGRLAQARPFLLRVYRESPDPEVKDRALWFYLDTSLSDSPARFLEDLYFPEFVWQDPDYFTDLMDKCVSLLVSAKEWSELWKLYQFTSKSGPLETRGRLAYITARLYQLGVYKKQAGMEKKLLEVAASQEESLYYNFLSSFLLEKEPAYFPLFDKNLPEESPGPLEFRERMILGYLDFGMQEDAFALGEKFYEELSLPVLRRVASEMAYGSRLFRLISLMRKARGKGKELAFRDLYLLYPMAYKEEIQALSRDFGIAPALVLALVYAESAFNEEIKSSAGARGLTQLMPETAADMARLLRMDEYDLDDGKTNLTLGTKYLSKLMNLLESVPLAYVAYNAGLGRLRQWQRTFPGYPEDLLVEALPYEETYFYVRKIVEAFVFYSCLYENGHFAPVLSFFYAHL